MNKPRARTPHELKTWPEEFQAVLEGLMPFQLRRNDRNFKVGDELRLQEWDPDVGGGGVVGTGVANILGYTGRELLVRVDYIMDDLYRTIQHSEGYVIMSVSLATNQHRES